MGGKDVQGKDVQGEKMCKVNREGSPLFEHTERSLLRYKSSFFVIK